MKIKESGTFKPASGAAGTADIVLRTGTVPFTADQSMGGFKLTNLAVPVSANDAARKTDVDAKRVPVVKVKTANQAVANSTTLVDDNHLSLSLESGKTYLVQMFLSMAANGFALFKFTVAYTGTSSEARFGYGATNNNSASVSQGDLAFGTESVSTGNANSQSSLITVSAYITTTSTGTCKLQWAQSISHATATTLQRASSMIVTEVV